MHVIIQIPCFNEAETLPAVIGDLPRSVPGVTRLEYLVIDDGSQDATVQVAKDLGVHRIVSHARNLGLAAAFQTGMTTALHAGADIIVNTDGDNQYPGDAVADLIQPVLNKEADMVIADRQTQTIAHFSFFKRLLQRFGSKIVQQASGLAIPDATSGFRAISRDAALRLVILTRYTYTLESIIQAGKRNMKVVSVPIVVNPPLRPSRLVKSNWSFVKAGAANILRVYTRYEPLRTFSYLAVPPLLGGLVLLVVYWLPVWQRFSEILLGFGGTLVVLGLLIFLFGVLADLTATNRMLLEELIYQQRRIEARRVAQDVPESEGGVESPGES